jgi:hypothetical protein
MTITELASRWTAEAKRHEDAAQDRFEREDDEERLLHLEISRVLRNCSRELSESAK